MVEGNPFRGLEDLFVHAYNSWVVVLYATRLTFFALILWEVSPSKLQPLRKCPKENYVDCERLPRKNNGLR